MPLVLPYPGHPANGDPFDATQVAANINAIAQAVQSFDGSQVQAATIQPSALATAGNPQQLLADTMYPFIVPNTLIWSAGAGLVGSMTAGTIYNTTPGGLLIRVPISAIASFTFTPSKDTYIDVDYNGNFTYTAVANNAVSPSLAANSIRIAIVTTSGSAITNINQGQETMVLPIASSIPYAVTDSLGNLICPRDPNRKILGYRQILSNVTVTAPTTTQPVPGLSCPVIVPTGRKVKVTIFTFLLVNSGGSVGVTQSISVGTAADANRIAQSNTGAIPATYSTTSVGAYTPASASTTFVYGVQAASGNITVSAFSAPNFPAYIMVELV